MGHLASWANIPRLQNTRRESCPDALQGIYVNTSCGRYSHGTYDMKQGRSLEVAQGGFYCVSQGATAEWRSGPAVLVGALGSMERIGLMGRVSLVLVMVYHSRSLWVQGKAQKNESTNHARTLHRIGDEETKKTSPKAAIQGHAHITAIMKRVGLVGMVLAYGF